ncbi:centromere protein H [Brachionichthys hirsutus]|uniref:centromere protein H n=1 Tax=Brachionichthys hirsutus TaxID=412623 RepID=UPI0036054610
MDSSDNMENLNHMVDAVVLSNGSNPDSSTGHKGTSLTDMLRMKKQMSNQCFEMAVQLLTGKSKSSCSQSDAERDLQDYVSELERVKTVNFNSTLILHRMQMWHAIGEKLKENDSQADDLKAVSERFLTLCTHIKQLQQESRDLQDEITELQKKRLEMKRLIHEKMKETEELISKKHFPDTDKFKGALGKGMANLEKYKKMVVMMQNVIRGLILACKVNWMDDPKLRDIAMTLEELPISE